MPRAYPVELRERVVRAVEENGLSYADAAETFDVGEASVSRYLHRARQGYLAPTEPRRGTRRLLNDSALEVLVTLLQEHPDYTLDEHAVELTARTGIAASRATVGRAVRRLGYTRKKR